MFAVCEGNSYVSLVLYVDSMDKDVSIHKDSPCPETIRRTSTSTVCTAHAAEASVSNEDHVRF